MKFNSMKIPYQQLSNLPVVLNTLKSQNIDITIEELINSVKISNLLKTDPEFKLWSGVTPQINWKVDNVSYMWRQTNDIVEVAINSNWEDMSYYTPQELIVKLREG